MWYASIVKPATVVATVLLAAGIVWAAQQGGGEAKIGAAANGLELQVSPEVAEEIGEDMVVALASDGGGNGRAAQEEQRRELARTIRALRRDLQLRNAARGELIVELEIHEMEKALLSRELEHLHEILVRLRLPQEIQLEEPDAEGARNELLAKVLRQSSERKTQLGEQIERTVQAADALEMQELERAALQRRLEELQHLLMLLDTPASTQAPPSAALDSSQLFPRRQPLSAEDFQGVVIRQLEQLLRQIGRLQAENAELKKQLEELR